jgi:hypothetical protein
MAAFAFALALVALCLAEGKQVGKGGTCEQRHAAAAHTCSAFGEQDPICKGVQASLIKATLRGNKGIRNSFRGCKQS